MVNEFFRAICLACPNFVKIGSMAGTHVLNDLYDLTRVLSCLLTDQVGIHYTTAPRHALQQMRVLCKLDGRKPNFT